MAVRTAAAARGPLPPSFWIGALGLAAANAGTALYLWLAGIWPLDAEGLPLPTDFLSFYAASRATLSGAAAGLYDPAVAKAAQVAALGRDFAGDYGWHYPPPFLLVTAPLSLTGLVPAQLAWTGTTLAAYGFAAAAIAGWRGVAVALALPAALATLVVGQNGFLTAALFGGALALLPGRPVAGGLLIGLVALKPQLGLLVPLALAAAGEWRAFGAAAASAILAGLLSLVLLGPDVWIAFAGSVPAQSDLLAEGAMGFAKLQSAYGLGRALGGSRTTAWILQAITTLAAVLAVRALWQSRAPSDTKAAGLVAGSLLATPYLYLYDLTLLAIPAAFLVRNGLDRTEVALLAAAALVLLGYPLIGTSCGLAASLLTAGLVGRRAWPAIAARPTPPVDKPAATATQLG